MIDSLKDAKVAYRRDGAAVLREVLPACWVDRMRNAVDRAIGTPSESSVEYTQRGGTGRYVGDFFVWMRDPDFRALAIDSPLPALAAELTESKTVRLFYDHLLVKEPMTREETPWHQDLPYWPVRGEQILSLWVPLDPVTPESGAVRYLRGSHRRHKMYAPRAFAKDSGFASLYEKMGLAELRDEDIRAPDADILAWATEPGDAIVHHPLVLHYASGNLSTTVRRRAIALRYLGEDAVYDARPGTFVEKESIRAGLLEPIDYADGEKLAGSNFPLVWPPSLDGTGQ